MSEMSYSHQSSEELRLSSELQMGTGGLRLQLHDPQISEQKRPLPMLGHMLGRDQ